MLIPQPTDNKHGNFLRGAPTWRRQEGDPNRPGDKQQSCLDETDEHCASEEGDQPRWKKKVMQL